jgi:hypothetical protein
MRRTAAILAAITLAIGGCDTIGSDFQSIGEKLAPPSPQEAAQWAVDTTDSENMRRGTVLLGTSAFGGAAPYVKLYRFYAKDIKDPLVQAAAITALSRFGDPADALLLAEKLAPAAEDGSVAAQAGKGGSPFPKVRLASAIGLQRLHNRDPIVVETMWRRLQDETEEPETRVELAIGLGQYAQDDVFQALCAALDQSELSVNVAARDSLTQITGVDFGLDKVRWLGWYTMTPESKRFIAQPPYLFPTFQRHLVFWDYVVFWDIPRWESPALPRGLADAGARSTYPTGTAPPAAVSDAPTPR